MLYEELIHKKHIIGRQISMRLIQTLIQVKDDLPNLVPTNTNGMPGAKCWSSGIHWRVHTN